ncbi:25409_t:CDS:2 [Gigaspora margarita]|uniref:25409_t:CDS:1 n=1 Tax=Gigaspora margarita TaxID=4874 RepID=A0ABN7VF94_GIGMA|nr:25409_t:CDS:2 [Gigaspora margarita]
MFLPITLSKSFKRNLRKNKLHAIKKIKFEKPNSIIGKDDSIFNSSANQIEEIVYDPLKHKTQPEAHKLEKEKEQQYILSQWISEDFLASDLKPKSEIFNNKSIENPSTRKMLWEEFADWSCFAVGPKFGKQFCHHCCCLWSKVNHMYQYVEAQDNHNIQETLLRHPDNKLCIADETTKLVASGINLKGYYYIFKSQCFLNISGETIVDFFDIDKISAEESEIAIDNYFKHMFDNPIHQSNQFKSGLIEYFGSFTDSNNLPYTTANTASSYNKAHQKYVKDHWNSLCVVCPLGRFEDGELVFPELKLVVHAKQGQAIAFHSNLLVHENLPITTRIRHSVVFYIHSTVIKLKLKFGSLFADFKLDWGSNNEEAESSQIYISSKLGSQKPKPKNHRRSHIDLESAKRGMLAKYKNNT